MDGENGSSQAFKTLASYDDLHPAVMPSAGVDGENGSYQAPTMEAYDGDLHLGLAPPTSPPSSAPLDSSATVHASSSLQEQEERGGVDGALENGRRVSEPHSIAIRQASSPAGSNFSGVVPIAPKPLSSTFPAVMTPYGVYPLYPPPCPVAQSVGGGASVSTAPPIPGVARINQPPILVPAVQAPDGSVFMLVQPPYTGVQSIGLGTPISPDIQPPIWDPPVQTPHGVYLAVQSTGEGTPPFLRLLQFPATHRLIRCRLWRRGNVKEEPLAHRTAWDAAAPQRRLSPLTSASRHIWRRHGWWSTRSSGVSVISQLTWHGIKSLSILFKTMSSVDIV